MSISALISDEAVLKIQTGGELGSFLNTEFFIKCLMEYVKSTTPNYTPEDHIIFISYWEPLPFRVKIEPGDPRVCTNESLPIGAMYIGDRNKYCHLLPKYS